MRKLLIAAFLIIVFSISGLELAGPAHAQPKGIELSMTSNLPQSSVLSQTMIAWGNELEKRTQGRVKIGQATWGGALLKSTNIMQGLGKGVADIAFISTDYARSLFPIIRAVSPVFLDDGYHAAHVEKDLYENTPEIRKEFRKNNIRPLYFLRGSNGIMGTTFAFTGIEGLKAKRLRAVGEAHDLVAKLGAIPVNISPGDTYVGIQKGTVDGFTGQPAYVLHTYKLAEVLKQVTDTRFGCYSVWMGAGMNLDTYNRLPDDVKKVIEEIAPVAIEYYAKADDEDGFKGLELCKQRGVAIVQLSVEESEKWMKVVDPSSIWEKYIKDAESAGYPARRIMAHALKLWDQYKKQYPHKSLFERFLEKK